MSANERSLNEHAPTGAVFEFKRKRLLQSATNGCALLILAAFIAMMFTAPFWPMKIFAGFGAALGLLIVSNSLREIVLPGPALRIGPDGMLYPALYPEVIPWADITEVCVQRGMAYDRTGGDVKFTPALTISFEIADPKRYNGGYFNGFARGMAGSMGLAPIVLNQMYIDATSEQILDAIRLYWRGTISEFR